MQSLKSDQIFNGRLDNYDCIVSLFQNILNIQMMCSKSFSKYIAQLDETSLKGNKNLSFFFQTLEELYQYLTTSFEKIIITKNKALSFNLEMNLGSKSKLYECLIETVNKQLGQQQFYNLKMSQMQSQIQILRQKYQQLKTIFENQQQEQQYLKAKFIQYQRMINSKDEIINIIFHELKQIKEWRQQKLQKIQEVIPQDKFVIDETNPHSKKFLQIGNRYKKITGGSWDVLINKYAIVKHDTIKYHFRQIRAGTNGSFMYGIGTQLIKGLNRAQDSKQFIGYYQNTGNVYQQGESKKGGPKIKDGQIITMIIDPKIWKISWLVNGKKQAEANIGAQIRDKDLYLALIIFNEQSQIEFFN